MHCTASITVPPHPIHTSRLRCLCGAVPFVLCLCVIPCQPRAGSAAVGSTEKSAKALAAAAEKSNVDTNADLHPPDSDLYNKRPHQVDKMAATDRANETGAGRSADATGNKEQVD